MTRVFLDVGAHHGESIFKALDPRLHFDRIVAFEPSVNGCLRIARINSKIIQIESYGLGESNESATLFGAGNLGGSIFSGKTGIENRDVTETIEIKNASLILKPFLEEYDECFLKLNCEGSEIAILSSLASENLLGKFKDIYIDWDARKIPALKNEIPKLIQLLNKHEAKWVDASDFKKSGWHGVGYWLEAYRVKNCSWKELIEYRTYNFLSLRHRVEELIKNYFPKMTVWLVRIKNKIR
jgi:FkbM family methyltransferase